MSYYQPVQQHEISCPVAYTPSRTTEGNRNLPIQDSKIGSSTDAPEIILISDDESQNGDPGPNPNPFAY